jgi:hypothetical protein
MEIAISLRNETLVGDDNCEVLSDRGMENVMIVHASHYMMNL